MNRLILPFLMLAGMAQAQSQESGAYGNAVVASAAVPVTATTLSVTSSTTVSTTALNVARNAVLVRVVCDNQVGMAFIPGTTGTMVVSETSTAFRILSGMPEVFVLPPSHTIALRANSATASCNLGRMGR